MNPSPVTLSLAPFSSFSLSLFSRFFLGVLGALAVHLD
jgi:hypothetical protein